MAAVKHPDDKLSILGRALITHNTAAHGAGIYLRSFEKRAGSILTVSDSAAITDNIALGCGGGINFSGFREDAEIPSSLTVSGNVRISGNASAYGEVFTSSAAVRKISWISKRTLSSLKTVQKKTGRSLPGFPNRCLSYSK